MIICSKGCPPFGGVCVETCHHAGAVDSCFPCDTVRVERGENAFRGGSEGVVVWRRGAEEADEFAVFDCRRAGHSGEFRGTGSGRAGICCLSAARFSRTMACAAARCSGVNCVIVIRSSLSIVMSYYTISARRSSSPTSIKIKISPIYKVWGEGEGAGGDCRILGNYFHFHSIIHNNSSLPIWHEPQKLFMSTIKWKRFPDLRQSLFRCDFRKFVV